MSYAVLHIIKANSSLNSIAKHIERTAHPENADPARTHLNRYNLVEYPDGITGLAAAVEHRIANAGITRKISDRQVRCLNLVMTSDNEGMQKIIDSGKLDEWIADNIKWARDTFGGDNVVGAALHMDERTPHLHIAVVPIVTAERKKKAREATAKKRYRTKAANRPRLCADDIMERGKMSRYQDIYAEAMAKYGLERGIRGSEARHIGQHEYYRDCMMKKKGLEQDVATLSVEKNQLDSETQSLEKRKTELERGNRWIENTITETKAANKQLSEENAQLVKDKKLLVEYNSTLKEIVVGMIEEYKGLETSKEKLSKEVSALEASKMSVAYDSDYAEYKADIEKYFPDVPDLLIWARYCKHIGFPDSFTQRIIDQQPVPFQGALYSPEHSQRFKTEYSEAKLERDPKEKHRFILTIDGVNVFQWFRNKAKELLAKIGIKPKEPKRGPSLGR
mgnify:CR=1 FL=1